MNTQFDDIKLHDKINIFSIHTIYNLVFPENFRFPGERHDFWEFCYLSEGTLGVTSEEKIYSCVPGDLVIHPPNFFHTCWNTQTNSYKSITISFSGEGLGLFLSGRKVQLDEIEKQIIDAILKETSRCLTGYNINYYSPLRQKLPSDDESFQIIKNYLEILCLKIIRKNRENTDYSSNSSNAILYKSIVNYLKDHLLENVRIEEISKALFKSPSTLKSVFRKYTNCGIMEYYNRLRCDHCIQLIEQDISMRQIAEIMNFSSQNYFSYFFKKNTGLSPFDYKSRLQNADSHAK